MGTPTAATVRILQDTVLRALNSGANLTHTKERETVTFTLASAAGPISVIGDLPELGNNIINYSLRASWHAGTEQKVFDVRQEPAPGNPR